MRPATFGVRSANRHALVKELGMCPACRSLIHTTANTLDGWTCRLCTALWDLYYWPHETAWFGTEEVIEVNFLDFSYDVDVDDPLYTCLLCASAVSHTYYECYCNSPKDWQDGIFKVSDLMRSSNYERASLMKLYHNDVIFNVDCYLCEHQTNPECIPLRNLMRTALLYDVLPSTKIDICPHFKQTPQFTDDLLFSLAKGKSQQPQQPLECVPVNISPYKKPVKAKEYVSV